MKTWNRKLRVEKHFHSRFYLVDIENKKKYQINRSGADIIIEYSEKKTYEEGIKNLAIKHNDTEENVQEIVNDFLGDLKSFGIVLVDGYSPETNMVEIKAYNNKYPKVASIEVTNRCNLKCIHCYGGFGEANNTEMDIIQLKNVLDELDSLGVQVIELTGGDISVYGKLLEAIDYALSKSFFQINLLTNGVKLSDELLRLIVDNKERIIVQIDVHSLNNEYLKWFSGTETIDAKGICDNIQYLAERGVRIRIATIVTKRNMEELDSIALFARETGTKLGISPVEPLGRAQNGQFAEDLLLSIEESNQLLKKIEQLKENYPENMFVLMEEQKQRKNCGVLSDHVVISSSGDIKLCTMDNTQYFNSSIGNVFRESIKSIYDKKAGLIDAIAKQGTPGPNTKECEGCDRLYLCYGCLLRSFINIKDMGEKCQWARQNLNERIRREYII